MSFIEIFMIAVSLSMDAFAVSICKGLAVEKSKVRHQFLCGIYFGGFQFLMPLIGYFFSIRLEHIVAPVSSILACSILTLIGINMIREALGKSEESVDQRFSASAMIPLAVATSIDALAVGVSFAFIHTPILPACTIIGCTTFVFCFVGVFIGSRFGIRFKEKAQIAGGIILIFLGLRILIQWLLR